MGTLVIRLNVGLWAYKQECGPMGRGPVGPWARGPVGQVLVLMNNRTYTLKKQLLASGVVEPLCGRNWARRLGSG